METILEQVGRGISLGSSQVFPKIVTVVNRIFGCWHLEMSHPFTGENESYRTCVKCGARRRFDLQQWRMVGSFYYPQRQTPLY